LVYFKWVIVGGDVLKDSNQEILDSIIDRLSMLNRLGLISDSNYYLIIIKIKENIPVEMKPKDQMPPITKYWS